MRAKLAFFLLAFAAWLPLSVGGGMGCDATTADGGATAGTGGGSGGSTGGTSGEDTSGGTGGTGGGTAGTTGGAAGGTTGGTTGSEPDAALVFTPVGEALASDLIDIEFLPGQGGEAIVIGKGGNVYYMRNDFTFLSPRPTIAVSDDGEQGLLNVAADPNYASNGFIYLFYSDAGGILNRVQRFAVSVDVGADAFSLAPGPTLTESTKADSPNPGSNHNGGGMDFGADGSLYVGFGDGGGSASGLGNPANISQNPSTFLGKIVRVSGASGTPSASVFALGLRNPFTLTAGSPGGVDGIFIGDVGGGSYEEIDFAPLSASGINFGWDDTEGPTSAAGFTGPIHGYAHGDGSFADQDPEDTGSGSHSIMACTYYTGSAYGGALTGRFLYGEFFPGWVRSFAFDGNDVTDDRHMGHNTGMTSLQTGPDGLLYGVSLFGSDRILRVDLP